MNLKKIETDCNCAFISLAVFQSSFLLFVTIDIKFRRHVLLWQKAVILSFIDRYGYFSNFKAKKGS